MTDVQQTEHSSQASVVVRQTFIGLKVTFAGHFSKYAVDYQEICITF